MSGLIASRISRGLASICFNTGSLCKAKQRLPLELISTLTKKAAIVHPNSWKLGRVFVIDGSGVSMPDTPANRLAFPAHTAKTAGFPLARLAAIFSLESGSLVDTAVAPMRGKGTGETSLMNKLWDNLQAGDTLLGDALFSGYPTIYRTQLRGIHLVSELPKRSHSRLNRKLDDQIINLPKPIKAPLGVTKQEFASWPDLVTVRVVKLTCAPAGFRVKTKYILTTILDLKLIGKEDLFELYRKRWQAEINLRSIKTTLGMDILRGLTPEMVIKEMWVHWLAYNMIRAAICNAATIKKVLPSCLSFRGAQQILANVRSACSVGLKMKPELWEEILKLIGTQTIGNRPGRFEPRAIKRRKKNFALLNRPRHLARKRLHKKHK